MNRPLSRLGTVLAGSLMLAACSPTLTVVPHAMRCDASAELLASSCASPKPIPDDATFSAVVDASRDDRQALRECGISLNTLRESMNRCNASVDEFNRKVDELNAKNR
jgi:hypothetical protein